MKVGDKVKVNKDIPSISGMLREGTAVKIDHIYDLHKSAMSKNNLRVIDNLGKIWFLSGDDLNV